VEEKFVRALALHRGGSLLEARQLYLEILHEFSQHAGALHQLGLLCRQQGRHAEALALLRQAVAIRPGEAVFHGNLGNALRDTDQFPEAAQAYREAIRLAPDFFHAYNNLGVLLLRQRQPLQALDCLVKALQLAPSFVDALNNLGVARNELGQFDEAMACYARVLALQPAHQDALYNLGNCEIHAGNLARALEHFCQAVQVNPESRSGLASKLRQALIHYLRDEPEGARRALAGVDAPPGSGQAFSYQHYIASLLHWWDAAHPAAAAAGQIHAIGESHVLSAHGAVLDIGGGARRCQGWWIEGCKQWHLANGEANRFKAQFTRIVERLAPRSWLLLAIGEIDCRHDEGLLPAWRKSPGQTLASMIAATVEGHVHHVEAATARLGHRLVFCGVPASNYPADRMRAEDRPVLAQLIAAFNAHLERHALARGHRFLDLFSLTVGPDGFGNGRWHLDAHHLRPDAWRAAIMK